MPEPGWLEAESRIKEARRSGVSELYLSGIGLTSVPDYLAQLAHLQSLDLSGNQISAIPDSLAQLAKLQILYLYEIGRAHV